MTRDEKIKKIWALIEPDAEVFFHTIGLLLKEMSDEQVDKVLQHLVSSREHDPEICGCEYIGSNLWSCGHEDHAIAEEMQPVQIQDPEINRTLVVSTCHVKQETMEFLSDDCSEWVVYPYAEGAMMYVPPAYVEEEHDKPLRLIGEELIEIVRAAIELGVKYIQFDCDGPVYEELPCYEW
jgi:hypothetical protein